VLYVERGGRSLVALRDPDPSWLAPALEALVGFVRTGGTRRLALERFDGAPIVESDAVELFIDAGFLAGPRRLVLRP
jgi:ATP-dependent Lhr-like helicase